MNALKRIIKDIKQGENLELYLTIAIALIVSGLNLLSITPSNLLNSLILAIFAIIASSLIGNRHKLNQIQMQIGGTHSEAILRDYPDNHLEEDIERANELWVIGVHISFLRHFRGHIETKIRRGKSVHILLVDPNGHACMMAASRNPGTLSVERDRANIMASLDDLMNLKRIAPSKLQVKTIDYPMMYGGYIINPSSRDGVMYIKRYSYQTGVRPRYKYYSGNEWFEFIKTEFQSMWVRGKAWKDENRELSL